MFKNQENSAGGTGYTAIPSDFIVDTRLSSDARLAAIYMSSMPDGCLLSVSMVKQALGFGGYVWRRVSKELRQFGLLEDAVSKDGFGRVVGKRLRFKGL